MKVLFYLISLVPKSLIIIVVDIYIYTKIYKYFNSYKVTKVNLKIAYPDLNIENIEKLAKLSIRESLISVYETLYTWGRSHINSSSKIFKVKNNFLLKNKFYEGNGLILVSIHNRSVDMLLKWINSQITTVSLYKRVKNKRLDKFVKSNREHDGALCYETTMLGVRNLFKALKKNGAVCFAADQVPKRGMGEYINFFGRDAYSTTLVQSLAVKTKAAVMYLYINSSLTNFLSISIECCNNSIYDDSKHKLLLNNDIERIINKRPIDYSWEYKRFRRNHNPALDPYKNI
mgnify:CR=1 FL=1|tara:strand:- start:286 stop:1149 length:864 start_codon:yes stop_codon:yes gene_type:complete